MDAVWDWTRQVLTTPQLTLTAIAIVVASAGWWQKQHSDRQTAWWKKFEWVVESLDADGENQRQIAWAILPDFLEDRSTTRNLRPFAQRLRVFLESRNAQVEEDLEALQEELSETTLDVTIARKEESDND